MVKVSIIIPTYNASTFLPETLNSIIDQTFLKLDDYSPGDVQVSFYDDNSQDNTVQMITTYIEKFLELGISTVFSSYLHPTPIYFQKFNTNTDIINSQELQILFDEIIALHTSKDNPYFHDNDSKPEDYISRVLKEHNFIKTSSPNIRKQCVGHSRNSAIRQSTGTWLCMLDSDDVMFEHRLEKQYTVGLELMKRKSNDKILLGGHYIRIPEDATPRYNQFLNSLQNEKDILLYRFRDLTIIQPTWFLTRALYSAIPGGYTQLGRGNPEDLLFFYTAIEQGASVDIIPENMTKYRYHATSTSWTVSRQTMLTHRVTHLEKTLLGTIPLATTYESIIQKEEEKRLEQEMEKKEKMEKNAKKEREKKERIEMNKRRKLEKELQAQQQAEIIPQKRDILTVYDNDEEKKIEQIDIEAEKVTQDNTQQSCSRTNVINHDIHIDKKMRLDSSENVIYNTSNEKLLSLEIIDVNDNIVEQTLIRRNSTTTSTSTPTVTTSLPPSINTTKVSTNANSSEVTYDILPSTLTPYVENNKFRWNDPDVKFGIWGNGRDGKQFYNRLSDAAKKRVDCFYDINPNKIGQPYLDPRSTKDNKIVIPIRHVSEIKAPFLVCVALDQTDGDLESNIVNTGAIHGIDYYHAI